VAQAAAGEVSTSQSLNFRTQRLTGLISLDTRSGVDFKCPYSNRPSYAPQWPFGQGLLSGTSGLENTLIN
jgi:hypothetical protein